MTLTVRLPDTIESQLSRFCDTMGLSKSQVVQSALRDWFAKPAVAQSHPLLAFVDAAAVVEPVGDWAGPYSKDRLRQRVLASGAAHRVAEPATAYAVNLAEQTDAPKAAKKGPRSRAAKTTAQSKSKPV
jgi:predicted transcriptional regulator